MKRRSNTISGYLLTPISMLSGSSRNISISPDGKKVFVATQNGRVNVVDVATDAVREITLTGASETYGVTILRDGSLGFASDVSQDKVFLFNPNTELEIMGGLFPLSTGSGSEPRGITSH